MARLERPEFDLELEVDGTTNEPPKKTEPKSKAKTKKKVDEPKEPKSYSLSKDNHKWLMTEAMRLSIESEKRTSASSLLDEIINKYRGKSL